MESIRGTVIYRQKADGVIAYARWRDSTRTQRTQRLGVAWVKRHGSGWRNRSGRRPDGMLSIGDAELLLRERIEAHGAELAAAAERRAEPSFADVAWAWHAHGRDVAGWKASTLADREHTLRAHLIPAFGDVPVRSIDRDRVRRWWSGLHSAKRKAAKPDKEQTGRRQASRKDGRLSNRNANKLLTELRAVFNWAADEYGLAVNPAEGIAKHREHTSERPSFYSPEQVEALCRAAASTADALAFRLAAYAGLRRGEVVSLRWRAIDFTRSSLHITESVSAGQDSTTKSGRGRTVPLTTSLAQALAAARPDDVTDDDLVIPGQTDGAKLDASALRRRFVAARDRAGLPPLRLHDLRHTFGSLAIDGGASLVQVQAWLGHSDIKTTSRYLHARSQSTDAALLDRAFSAGTAAELIAS